jgi:nucleoside-triphosphatase THEP1
MKYPAIWMISGERQAGKTSFCQELARMARQSGWEMGGILSPAVFEQGVKIGILAQDVRSGETRRLASLLPQGEEDLQFSSWFFDRRTLAWGNAIFETCLPCDLLVIDEIGPLELNHQMGWTAAIPTLSIPRYRLALVVLRPELFETARRLIRFTNMIAIDRTRSIIEWVHDLWPLMMGKTELPAD